MTSRFPYWLDQSAAALFFAFLAELGQWVGLPVDLVLVVLVALPHATHREPRGILRFIRWLIVFVGGWLLVIIAILLVVGVVLAFLGKGTWEQVLRGLGYLAYLNFLLNVGKAPVQPANPEPAAVRPVRPETSTSDPDKYAF